MNKLEKVARSWREAAKREEELRSELRDAVQEAVREGTPKAQIAKIAGVSRQTVISWCK